MVTLPIERGIRMNKFIKVLTLLNAGVAICYYFTGEYSRATFLLVIALYLNDLE